MANGEGKFEHLNGDIYDGQWVNDAAHGFGTYKILNGQVYKGDWANDK